MSTLYILRDGASRDHVLGVFSTIDRLSVFLKKMLLVFEESIHRKNSPYFFDVYVTDLDEGTEDDPVRFYVKSSCVLINRKLHRTFVFGESGYTDEWVDSLESFFPNSGKLTKACRS